MTRSLGKKIILGKAEGSIKRGRANVRRFEAVSDTRPFSWQDLSRAVNNRIFGSHDFIG